MKEDKKIKAKGEEKENNLTKPDVTSLNISLTKGREGKELEGEKGETKEWEGRI